MIFYGIVLNSCCCIVAYIHVKTKLAASIVTCKITNQKEIFDVLLNGDYFQIHAMTMGWILLNALETDTKT